MAHVARVSKLNWLLSFAGSWHRRCGAVALVEDGVGPAWPRATADNLPVVVVVPHFVLPVAVGAPACVAALGARRGPTSLSVRRSLRRQVTFLAVQPTTLKRLCWSWVVGTRVWS